MSEPVDRRTAGSPESGEVWQIWTDTGGTFTDCVAVTASGRLERAKVLSSGRVRATVSRVEASNRVTLDADWHLPAGFFRGCRLFVSGSRQDGRKILDYHAEDCSLEIAGVAGDRWPAGATVEIDSGVEAPVLAAHWITRTALLDDLPSNTMRLATTRGTNALLERRGTPTALFITRGFGDLLSIGNQQRRDLFALRIEKSPPLYTSVVEVEERVSAAGEVLVPLALEAMRPAAVAALAAGVTSAAVALMHSYRFPDHEHLLASYLEDLGFEHVSCSADLASRIKLVPRAETAVVNAYLAGVIGRYLATVSESVRPGPLLVMTSAGSLVRDTEYLPKDSLLSGPAGGVIGAAALATQSGWSRSLAFDMGGTSTDVSRYDGTLDYRFETEVGDARLLSPSLAIETVAAGGGSICHFDGRQLKVGPHSAGADPGPACYGADGPLTLTDVNLLLGRLSPTSFEIPIDTDLAVEAADDLMREIADEVRWSAAREQVLQGLLDIANERMAEAVRRISIRQGYRPAEFALVAFGGAGGQHACALAEILEMETVLVPENAGLLSAIGLGRARIERLVERQVLRRLDDVIDSLGDMLQALAEEARSAVEAEGVVDTKVDTSRRYAYVRLEGQETSLPVRFRSPVDLAEGFSTVYQDHYGYRPGDRPLEVESLRVIAASAGETVEAEVPRVASRRIDSERFQRAFLGGQWSSVPVFDREELSPGDRFDGPALVFERHCATVVHPGWIGSLDAQACLLLRRRSSSWEGGTDDES